jgi:hypothetical protein
VKTEIFLQARLDRANQLENITENSAIAHVNIGLQFVYAVTKTNRKGREVRRYEFLDQPSLRCLHFVRTSLPSEILEEQIEAARKIGVKFAYWNYLQGGRNSTTIASPLGLAIGLVHPSYGKLAWVQFLDDLITLAYRYNGLVIVIDRADLLLAEKSDEMFECVEAFMVQFHHWYDQKKPCHLCFQMVEDPYVTDLFRREAASR